MRRGHTSRFADARAELRERDAAGQLEQVGGVAVRELEREECFWLV